MGHLIDWWRRRAWSQPRYPDVHRLALRSDAPVLPPRRQLLVIGPANRPKWALMACPCGHGHPLAMNLSPKRRPFWTLEIDSKGPTLRPSVDSRLSERRCHFWLRSGQVTWAPDDVDNELHASATLGTSSRG